jgi:RecA-family ATPase
MPDEIDDVENAELEQDLVSVEHRRGLASIGKAISLAKGFDLKRKAWRNGFAEALRWPGMNQSTAVDELFALAEAKDLVECFGADAIQGDLAEEVTRHDLELQQAHDQQRAREAPKTNGNGRHEEPWQETRQEAPKPEPPLEPLDFISAADFEGREVRDREFLVANRIPMRTVGLLGGDGGTGKTGIALQLGVGVVKTGDWLNATIPDLGGVMFVTAEEDEDEVHRRLHAICNFAGISFKQLADLQVRCMPTENAVLAQPDKHGQMVPTKLFTRLELAIKLRRPRLIVLESSSDLFGGNENERREVRQFISLLRSWCYIDGAALMLLSHPSQSGRASGSGDAGSTQWNNGPRWRMYFKVKKTKDDETDEDAEAGDFRTLEIKKANYSRTGEMIECVRKNGVYVPIGAAEATITPEAKANREANAERVFLRCLDIRNSREQWVNHQESSWSRYAPKVFLDMPEREGVSLKLLAAAMGRLLDKKMLKLARSGPKSKPTIALVRAQFSLIEGG